MSAPCLVYDTFYLWLPCSDTFAQPGQKIITESRFCTELHGSAQYGIQPKRRASKFCSLQISRYVGGQKCVLPVPVFPTSSEKRFILSVSEQVRAPKVSKLHGRDGSNTLRGEGSTC